MSRQHKCCDLPCFFPDDPLCCTCGALSKCCDEPVFVKYARKCKNCGNVRFPRPVLDQVQSDARPHSKIRALAKARNEAWLHVKSEANKVCAKGKPNTASGSKSDANIKVESEDKSSSKDTSEDKSSSKDSSDSKGSSVDSKSSSDPKIKSDVKDMSRSKGKGSSSSKFAHVLKRQQK